MTDTTTPTACSGCLQPVIRTPDGRQLDPTESLGIWLPDGTALSIRDVQNGRRGHHEHLCTAPEPHQEVLL